MPDIDMVLGASDCINLLLVSKLNSVFLFQSINADYKWQSRKPLFLLWTRSVNHLIFSFF